MSNDTPDDHSESEQEQNESTAPYNAAEPEAVRKRETKMQRAQRLADHFWRTVLNDEIGRRELWRLVAIEGHAFAERFAVGPNGFPQPEATWFAAGEQAFALRLYHSLMRVEPALVALMHAEHDARFGKKT